jgi:hypothetical protein
MAFMGASKKMADWNQRDLMVYLRKRLPNLSTIGRPSARAGRENLQQ